MNWDRDRALTNLLSWIIVIGVDSLNILLSAALHRVLGLADSRNGVAVVESSVMVFWNFFDFFGRASSSMIEEEQSSQVESRRGLLYLAFTYRTFERKASQAMRDNHLPE